MKVGIVGAGFVGSTAGFAMVMTGAASEIVLVDANPAPALAQAQDIAHAIPFAHAAMVRQGDYAELAGAGVVGAGGVLGTVMPPLTGEEEAALKRSAEILKAAATSVESVL